MPDELINLARQLLQTDGMVVQPAFRSYVQGLVGMLRTDTIPPETIYRFVLRNCYRKLGERLRTVNRPFKPSIVHLLRDWWLKQSASIADNDALVPSYPVRLSGSILTCVSYLLTNEVKLDGRPVNWATLLEDASLAPHASSAARGTFSKNNAHVWAAFLSYHLACITAALNALESHDNKLAGGVQRSRKMKVFTTSTTHALPPQQLDNLSVSLEVLSHFFYGDVSSMASFPMSLPTVIQTLFSDVDFGLADFLVLETPSSAVLLPSDDDTFLDDDRQNQVEDTMSVRADAEGDESTVQYAGTALKWSLINLCGFFLATQDVACYFRSPTSSPMHPWNPNIIVITGTQTPSLVLSLSELSAIREWLNSLPFQDRTFNKLKHDRFFQNAPTTGIHYHFHCESILMALMHQAKDPAEICSGTTCDHEDARCHLFREAQGVLGLWGSLSRAIPIAVCPKKACAHCAFTALYGHQHYVNTDGSHGIGFRTKLFGLHQDAERRFATLLLHSLLYPDDVPKTNESSPNKSLAGATPPTASEKLMNMYGAAKSLARLSQNQETDDEDMDTPTWPVPVRRRLFADQIKDSVTSDHT
ncbi:hypothetical protein DACRYDRAFT_15519 [Dacryopinax primogenitus]|uniref:Uncharacterized protein n=1 Tax=Dacryopinax primogenitus (strain DJM 731) TaxID=1858805 RepID=M5G1N0_DACPD|nr:uncharacterized protein DACRYDRAFT_15519 [Dacryopinax primogenitus]EJU02120.1 hypothetical protein DACRYDRAFT_15519 [Dacryopinax primogenitus]